MEVEDKIAVELFDERAELHENFNAVLDAANSLSANNSNVLHDYFSKRYISQNVVFKKDYVVLDFGCGIGRLSEYFAPKVKHLIGVDASKKMLDIARKQSKSKNVTYLNELSDVKNNSCKIIFVHWVMAHVSDDGLLLILKEFNRILQVGGTVAIFEQIYIDKNNKLVSDVYSRRSYCDYVTLFEKAGFQLSKASPVYRTPSYARSIWNKLSMNLRSILPLLYLLEKMTVNYKKGNIEYITNFFEFKLNGR